MLLLKFTVIRIVHLGIVFNRDSTFPLRLAHQQRSNNLNIIYINEQLITIKVHLFPKQKTKVSQKYIRYICNIAEKQPCVLYQGMYGMHNRIGIV